MHWITIPSSLVHYCWLRWQEHLEDIRLGKAALDLVCKVILNMSGRCRTQKKYASSSPPHHIFECINKTWKSRKWKLQSHEACRVECEYQRVIFISKGNILHVLLWIPQITLFCRIGWRENSVTVPNLLTSPGWEFQRTRQNGCCKTKEGGGEKVNFVVAYLLWWRILYWGRGGGKAKIFQKGISRTIYLLWELTSMF